ncbi:MAG: hypothetical protein JWQ43_4069 [Glaciihabitans sp.]|nr:hypothetical protein [Glaciihabitans sp.]
MTAATYEEIVTALLSAAGLTVSAEEKAVFVSDYPLLRDDADALYLPELEFIEPANKFDPTLYYPSL